MGLTSTIVRAMASPAPSPGTIDTLWDLANISKAVPLMSSPKPGPRSRTCTTQPSSPRCADSSATPPYLMALSTTRPRACTSSASSVVTVPSAPPVTSTWSGSLAVVRTSSNRVARSTAAGRGVSTPPSMRLRMRSSSIRCPSRAAATRERSSMWTRRSGSSTASWARSVSRNPLMIVIGVRSSWDTRAMKSDFIRSSSITSRNRSSRSNAPPT